ncbi:MULTISPECIES: PfkB family carbohydrate kinase [Amycolatopsis]|uniref:PfkB family carbohydrate kinase n=1 Tax=Amycolatopsis TaxID=1813 RepID=UPI000B8AC9BA|nr:MULTISPECIES: PfkB family carbohydrate kinase [Amycolatopsis]OXM62289.1 carbohydrate kinase family protein [Amycolatopsis sp. KNN50.9b]
MRFRGRFADRLVAEQLERVSLSFLVDDLTVRRGGVAANIAFGLAALGTSAVLVGAVGADSEDYRAWLEDHRIDTKSLRVSRERWSARFLCTTDEADNQIASFYAGAMTEAAEIGLGGIADRVGRPGLVVIAPNDPRAMVRHTRECRERGYPFAADVSQQLAIMTGAEVRDLVDGAEYLFTNAYEAALLRGTGWRHEEVLDRVGAWVITHGAGGVTIERKARPVLAVGAVPVAGRADPTGVGDAFRAGFLWGHHHRLGLERSAQVGCTLATIVLETVGPQEYVLERGRFADRVAQTYGGEAAGDVESRLRV